MRSEQRFQQILTLVGGFLMPLGLAVIGLGWYGTAHTGYVFEQLPYLVSGGLFGLGLTFCGALIFFSAWLALLLQLQREHAELTRRLLAQPTNGLRSTTQFLPVVDPGSGGAVFDREPSPPALDREQSAPAFDREPSAPAFDREPSAPAFDREPSAPAFDR